MANDPIKAVITIRPKDLSSKEIDATCAQMGKFDVPLFLNGKLCGSGTLVELDGRYGVLNADHVVRENRFDFESSQQRLGLAIQDSAHCFEIPMLYFRYICVGKFTGKEEGRIGPDIAIVEIPRANVGDIGARKSFYNLGQDTSKRLEVASRMEDGCLVYSGHPKELSEEIKNFAGFDSVEHAAGIGAISTASNYRRANDFDYLDMDYKLDGSQSPRSYKGMSGGGVWRVDITKNAQTNQLFFSDFTLAGVGYFQSEEAVGGFIICHGPESIYRKAVEGWKKAVE